MSDDQKSWANLKLKFDPFAPLKPPLQSVLTFLQIIEAILETVVEILKALGLFLVNPLAAIIALLLAAIRSIINQLQATGFSILVVTPDFGRNDFAAILASISGAYPGFERKVVYKLRDTSDLYRPSYPEGSAVAMLVFYIGADSPGDLLGQLLALLKFIHGPSIKTMLPSPVGLKVSTVAKSDDPVGVVLDVGYQAVNTFSKAGTANYVSALALEWRMPSSPAASNAPGFLNPFVSFYNSYRFPSFIVERSTRPNGDTIEIELDSAVAGKAINSVQARYGIPKSSVRTVLKENDKVTTFKFFERKITVDTAREVEGALTGTYRYLDKDVEAGKTYYYRVRPYFGDPSAFVKSQKSDYTVSNTKLVKVENNKATLFYDDGVSIGRPSNIAKGTAPVKVGNWNPYTDLYNATLVGILLNFELPPASDSDSPDIRSQKTGWGTLSMLGGTVGPYKAIFKDSNTFKTGDSNNAAKKLVENVMVRAAIRKVVNLVINQIINNASVNKDLHDQYSLLKSKVDATIETKTSWFFPNFNLGGVTGGLTDVAKGLINQYLALENEYRDGMKDLNGPYPTKHWKGSDGITEWSADERKLLATFLSSAYSGLGVNSSYLRWYSVTIGDLFPAFIPFIFDLLAFIESILKALKNILQEIINAIEVIIARIQELEQIIKAIIALIDLLKINLTVSVLAYKSPDASVEKLAGALTNSVNKPGDSPYGLHSGLVLTAGAPGQGVYKAIQALCFILGIKV